MLKTYEEDVESNPYCGSLLKSALVERYETDLESEFTRREDAEKLSRVDSWAEMDNPVVGTCRNCEYRGLVDEPEVGMFKVSGLEFSLVQKPAPLIKVTRREDAEKISRVAYWKYLDNPVVGTCRICGNRGLVDDPAVGIYRSPKPEPIIPHNDWNDWLNGD